MDLVREPGNAHDPNAIRVEHEGQTLGYVPREFARAWAPALDAGAITLCTVLAATRKNTVGEDVVMPLVWMRLYSREQHYELCDIGYQSPIRDFDGGWFYPAEHCFYVPDDDPSGRHRKGDVIVSADERVVVGLPSDTEPPAVLVIPEGVREIAPWACADSGADGVLLPGSLDAIRMFAFAGAGGWLVRIPAGVRHVSPGAFCASPILGDGWRPCYLEVDGANERLFAQGGSLIERVGKDRRLLYPYVDPPSRSTTARTPLVRPRRLRARRRDRARRLLARQMPAPLDAPPAPAARFAAQNRAARTRPIPRYRGRERTGVPGVW